MKKLIVIIPVILLISLSVYIGITYFNIGKYDEYYINNTIPVMKEEYIEQITPLKEKYNNKDVVGTIAIENTDFNTVVMQGNDNSYYLNHLPDKTYNINGSIFLDYRVDIDESDKLLIFGHSSPSYFLPIMIIENYKDEDYYKEHKYIYLSSIKEVKKYEIFSVFVETSDWSYMNLNYASKDEYLKHLQNLKSKSFYDTGVEVNKDDKILIMQTCSNMKEYSKYPKKYMLVIAKEVK